MSNKRSILLVDPKFQLKMSFIICSMVFITTLFYPVVISDLFNKISQLAPERMSSVAESQKELFIILFMIECGVLGVIFVVSIFVSHKIVGPIYKLRVYLDQYTENSAPLSFRQGDYFDDIPDKLNRVLSNTSPQSLNDKAYMEEAIDYIKGSNDTPENKLKNILAKFEESLAE